MVGAEVVNLFFPAQLVTGYFERCPSKSKAGTCGRNPKLRSLSECPDSGCEQGCHTVKCLGSISEQLFSHHRLFTQNSQICAYIEVAENHSCTGLMCQKTEFRAGRKPESLGGESLKEGCHKGSELQNLHIRSTSILGTFKMYIFRGDFMCPRGKKAAAGS